MRHSSIVVFCSILFPVSGFAATPRPVDAWADAVFALARQRSALVRDMVSELEASNVIVHIESSRLLPSGVGGTTRFVTSQGGYRYLRISLSIWLPPSDRVAILGHELQHAVELARSNVTDRDGVRRLLHAEGYLVRGDDFFETREALRVEKRIRMESRTLAPRHLGTLAPWHLGTLAPWHPGTLAPQRPSQ
jgi:hypothetical protein